MISIDYQEPYFLLSFPFNESDLIITRQLPIRDWDKTNKVWKVHQYASATLRNLKAAWSPKATKIAKETDDLLVSYVDLKFNNLGASRGILRPYQLVGSNLIQKAKCIFLNDEMGLGKTLQSIDAAVQLNINKCLILCPATLKWNWQKQFRKHFDIDPIIVDGNQKERQQLWNSKERFVIANYDILQRDWDNIPRRWDFIIADELTFLKNYSALRTKYSKRLKAECRVGLSGMVWENNLLEFHSMMDWVLPEILPSFFRFRQRYCVIDYFGGISGYKNLEELHQLTSPFILRRTKKEVLPELPPKIYTDFPLHMPKNMRQVYEKIAGEFIEFVKVKKDTDNPLVQTIRLRQFVEFPEILGFEQFDNLKLHWLEDVYSGTDKLLVFTFFEESASRLKQYFNTPFYISGNVPERGRLENVERFNEASRGIMVSTDAGRFGLDITGTHNVVHFGYFYNPATMRQREDRTHRIGQYNIVNILCPYYENTIDVGIQNIFLRREDEREQFEIGSNLMAKAKLSLRDYERLVYGD